MATANKKDAVQAQAWALQYTKGDKVTLDPFTFVSKQDAMAGYEHDDRNPGISYKQGRRSGVVKIVRVKVVAL